MITASVPVPSNSETKVQIHIKGLNAYPTPTMALLDYSYPPIAVKPSYAKDGLSIFDFVVDGPNVAVTGKDENEYIISTTGNCLVNMTVSQVKTVPGSGAFSVIITRGQGEQIELVTPATSGKKLIFEEGKVAQTDPTAEEATWTGGSYPKWTTTFDIDLT